MTYYKKYVEPVIKNFELFLKKYPKSDLDHFIKEIKSPLFELRSRKYKIATVLNLYFVIKNYYDYVDMAIGKDWFLGNHPEHRIYPYSENGVQYADKFSDFYGKRTLSKKHKGILTHKSSRRYPVDDLVNASFSGYGNNAEDLYIVPIKGKAQDFHRLHTEMRRAEYSENIDYMLGVLTKMANITRPINPEEFNPRGRGAAFLEREIEQEIKGQRKIELAAKDYAEMKSINADTEIELQKEIKAQEALIKKLKAEVQSKMSSIVKDGDEVKIAAFKTAQVKLDRLVEAQKRLIALKKKLRELKALRKRIKADAFKRIKSGIAENFYGLQK